MLRSTRWRNRYAIAESGARNCSAHAFRAAGAIPVPVSAGRLRRTTPVNICSLIWVPLARQPIGITKPSGLNFVQWNVFQRSRRRTARTQVIHLYFVSGALRLIDGCVELGFFKNRSRANRLWRFRVDGPDLRRKSLLLHENMRLLRLEFH